MPLDFTCPHCAATTNIADEFAGKTGPCARCGREVTIPYFSPSYRPRRTPRDAIPPRILQAVGAAAGLLLLVGLLAVCVRTAVPVWRQAQAERRREQCAENMKRIGQALRAYVADFGHLPLSHATDSSGTPLYSWRVVILPYLDAEEQQLYQRLRTNEPWNSAQNRYLLQKMPKVFGSPADPDTFTLNESSYHLIVDPSSAFPPAKTVRLEDITDDPATTIFLIEGRMRLNALWCEPTDVVLSPALLRLGNGGTQQLGGNHREGVQALFFDDEVRLLPLDTPRPELEAMLNIAGEK